MPSSHASAFVRNGTKTIHNVIFVAEFSGSAFNTRFRFVFSLCLASINACFSNRVFSNFSESSFWPFHILTWVLSITFAGFVGMGGSMVIEVTKLKRIHSFSFYF